MHRIEIDRSKHLCDEPHLGHNRYHPDVEPVLEVREGEEVVIETRDSVDGQLPPDVDESAFASLQPGAIHPLTGPVFVKGAEPGDVLEIEFLDIVAQAHGFSVIFPGFGFLRDLMTEPFLVHWTLNGGWATSDQIPGVRIPSAPFMGISALAPSAKEISEWNAREQKLRDSGGFALPPDPEGAIPHGPCAAYGLRTNPPRENGGNFDVKQLTKGAKLYLPVSVPGALFSTGDGHFAQGDGEVSLTAIEMAATVAVRFRIHKGLAERRKLTAPTFSHASYDPGPSDRIIGAMGYPIDSSGENLGENLTLAARNALLNMMTLLQERGFTAKQAYIICSVACDLRISNVVDLPNVTVSAIIPEAIFD
ncbi:MAG: formamidase [Gammaproteobacteria bacterium]|jgi:formamidase